MKDGYTFFANPYGRLAQADQIPAFIEKLRDVAQIYDRLVMPDNQIIACPAFRRAFRSVEHGPYLRDLINQKKLTAVMREGVRISETEFHHRTFQEFQPWYDSFNLWWEKSSRQAYMELDAATQAELAFFDEHMEKRFAQTHNRDRDFAAEIIRNLDNPVLRQGFGKWHALFCETAHKVYEDGASIGIIRVAQREEEGDQNIYNRLTRLLREHGMPETEVQRMGDLVNDYGRAMLGRVEIPLFDAEPITAPDQARILEIMQAADSEQVQRPVLKGVPPSPKPA